MQNSGFKELLSGSGTLTSDIKMCTERLERRLIEHLGYRDHNRMVLHERKKELVSAKKAALDRVVKLYLELSAEEAAIERLCEKYGF